MSLSRSQSSPYRRGVGVLSLVITAAQLFLACGGSSKEPGEDTVGVDGGDPSTGGVFGAGGSDSAGGTDGGGGGGPLGSGGFVPVGIGGSGGIASASGGASGDTGGASGEGAGGTEASGGNTNTLPDWPLINGVQWADTSGEPIQAHGGGILKVGQYYFFLGENRNPDNSFRAVSLYRSTDLRTWEHQNDILTSASDPELDGTNVERPKVIYNESTGQYVLWMHWENGVDYSQARAAVASSPTIDGDYTYHGSLRPLAGTGVTDHGIDGYMSRDCTLFVDDDGAGYFLSTANENYDLHLYRLSDDYLSIEERAALLFAGGHREAPALFKRGDTYFLVSSGSSGWQPNQAAYATSSSLVSGWSGLSNLGDGTTYYSQSTFVLAVEGDTTEYLYMGDRWAGAWGGSVNESTYLWQKLEFPSATTMTMTWDDVLAFDTSAGTIEGEITNFELVNKQSGLLLGIDGDSTAEGGDAVEVPGSGADSQSWKFDYDGAGYFKLLNQNSGLILDTPDESTESGVALHQWQDVQGDHQKWLVRDLGNGEFQIVSKNSGHFLSGTAAASSDGGPARQAAATEGDEQIWWIRVAE